MYKRVKISAVNKVAIGLYVAYFFLTFISHTVLHRDTHIIWSRVTPADFLGLLVLVISMPAIINELQYKATIPISYKAGALLTVSLIISSLFSLFPYTSLLESGIVMFLLCLSYGMFVVFKDRSLTQLLYYFMWGVIVFTIIGFYDLIAEQLNGPRIFPVAEYPGVFLAGFKNTGQAGSFYMVFFMLFIALRYSRLSKTLTKKHSIILNVALICCTLSIFTLGKYSVIIGGAVGIVLFLIYKRSLRLVGTILLIMVLLMGYVSLLNVALPDVYQRISFKFENRIVKNEINTPQTGFIETNFNAAITAFRDHPITGCGLNTLQCKYHTHETHSTYLKMLGEAGLIGLIGYIIFMFFFLKSFPVPWRKTSDAYMHFLQCLLPLLLGAMITWVYTYHLRKREFWILVVVVLIAFYKSKRQEAIT